MARHKEPLLPVIITYLDYLSRPAPLGIQIELPVGVVSWRVGDFDDVLGIKGDLGTEDQVIFGPRFEATGLVIQYADIGTINALGDDGPHDLLIGASLALFIGHHNIEQQTCGIAAHKSITLFVGWNGKGVWQGIVGCFC